MKWRGLAAATDVSPAELRAAVGRERRGQVGLDVRRAAWRRRRRSRSDG